MESKMSNESKDRSDNSIRDMIDEAKRINERGRRSAAGAKFMSELLEYITSESKRRAKPVAQEESSSTAPGHLASGFISDDSDGSKS
jgi:hypothetical protein